MRIIIMPGTKYSRMLFLPELTTADCCLFIDNDVECNMSEVDSFLKQFASADWDAGYGRLEARDAKSLVAKMVKLDKWISHCFIRPLLWELGIGISLPGQIFVLSMNALKKKTCAQDTFLDDLAFGLSLKMNKSKILYTNRTLGYEYPNTRISGLWAQRKRWAIGYADILSRVGSCREILFLLVHGFCYHLHWLLMWILLFIAVYTSIVHGMIILLLFAVLIAKGNVNLLPAAISYQFIFPFLHMRWLFYVIHRGFSYAQ